MRYSREFEQARFAILVVLLATCFLTGGASRLDVASLILLQPFAALCAMAFVLIPGRADWRAVRIPLLLLTGLLYLAAFLLVPRGTARTA